MSASDPFLGEIYLVPYNFAPSGWADCNGQLLSIASNSALFALLGINFGGNGQTTFGLPNLQSRMAVGIAQGPGLSDVVLGEVGGTETASLSTANLPAHSHPLNAQSGTGNTSLPANTAVLAQVAEDDGKPARAYSTSAADTTLASSAISSTGSGQAVDVRNPYLGMKYVIALQGIFPSRN